MTNPADELTAHLQPTEQEMALIMEQHGAAIAEPSTLLIRMIACFMLGKANLSAAELAVVVLSRDRKLPPTD